MEHLVALYNGKEPRVKTWDLWQAFGYNEHRFLKEVILKNKSLFESKGELLISTSGIVETKKKGRPDESYYLNERQFVLLIMLAKNTQESITFKDKVEIEFDRMRKTLANMAATKSGVSYQQARLDGKAIYKQKTDVIKQFVDYATNQGSESANRYYTNIAQMENKALFLMEQKYPNLREVLNVKQLMLVSTADHVIEKALSDGMEQELNYKEIYQLAKNRIIEFSEIVGKSRVIDFQQSLLTN